MDQPPAVAYTAFADVWPRATEAKIGTALCAAIGAGRTSISTPNQRMMSSVCLSTAQETNAFYTIHFRPEPNDSPLELL